MFARGASRCHRRDTGVELALLGNRISHCPRAGTQGLRQAGRPTAAATLPAESPSTAGFSRQNLWFMHRFYLAQPGSEADSLTVARDPDRPSFLRQSAWSAGITPRRTGTNTSLWTWEMLSAISHGHPIHGGGKPLAIQDASRLLTPQSMPRHGPAPGPGA